MDIGVCQMMDHKVRELTCGALQLCDPAQQPGINVGDGDAGQVGDVGQGEGGGNRNAET